MKKIIFLILISCSFISLTNAQTVTVYSTTNSGIPKNNINCVVIDNYGIKWLTMDSSISKFDGVNWTTYPLYISNVYLSKSINCIAIDHQNNKWIGTGYGLVKYDDTTFTRYTTANSGLITNRVEYLAVDSNNDIWIAGSIGLIKFNGNTWTRIDSIHDFSSIAVEPTGSHAIWATKTFRTNGYGYLFKYENNILTEYPYYYPNYLDGQTSSVVFDKENMVWLGTTGGGFYKFDRGNWTRYVDTINLGNTINYINCIAVDEFNNKWMGSSPLSVNPITTLIRYANDTLITKYTGFLAYNFINSIAIDSMGNKWMGTNVNGLWKMDCEKPLITAINGAALVGPGQQGLVYHVPDNHDALYYQWNLPAGFSGSSTGDSIIVNISSNAVSGIISVYGHNSCGDGFPIQLSVTVANGIGINENSKLADITVYPNPVANELNIANKGNELIAYEIYNTLGTRLCKGSFNNECIVNTTGFAKGIYYLKLNNGKDFNVQKVVKE